MAYGKIQPIVGLVNSPDPDFAALPNTGSVYSRKVEGNHRHHSYTWLWTGDAVCDTMELQVTDVEEPSANDDDWVVDPGYQFDAVPAGSAGKGVAVVCARHRFHRWKYTATSGTATSELHRFQRSL